MGTGRGASTPLLQIVKDSGQHSLPFSLSLPLSPSLSLFFFFFFFFFFFSSHPRSGRSGASALGAPKGLSGVLPPKRQKEQAQATASQQAQDARREAAS